MRIRSLVERTPIGAYFVLAYLISWGGSLAIARPEFFRGEPLPTEQGLQMGGIMLAGPFLSGLVLTFLLEGWQGLRDLFARMSRWRVGLRWYAAALLPFPILILAVLWTLSALVSPVFAPNFVTFGIVAGLSAGFIEETGWMGFAFPRMQLRFGVWRATICLALLHGLWHVMADYLGASANYGVYWLPRFAAMWFVAMTAMRVILVWIYQNTGSLLLAQLTHASSTGFLFIFEPRAISPANLTLYYALYAVVLWVPAAILLIRNGTDLIRKPLPADVA